MGSGGIADDLIVEVCQGNGFIRSGVTREHASKPRDLEGEQESREMEKSTYV